MFKTVVVLIVAIFVSAQVFAGGYEKVTMWGAKYSSMGGTAVSNVEGADSIFYNPAGLAHTANNEFSFNFSPTLSQFKGPTHSNTTANPGSGSETYPGTEQKSEQSISPFLSVLFSKKINEKFTMGFGIYPAGGTAADYKDVPINDLFANLGKADVKSELMIIEAALGGSFQLNQNWSFGGAWRLSHAQGELSSFSAANGGLDIGIKTELKDLEDQEFDGFKLGIQFQNDDKNFGVGLTYRSEINFDLEGTIEGTAQLAANAAQLPTEGGRIAARSTLPYQVSLGSYYKFLEKHLVNVELVYTDYSQNSVIDLHDGIFVVNNNGVNLADEIQQGWRDQWNIKFGYELNMAKFDLRFGYALTTPVVSEENARATFSSPGNGHTLTGGVGFDIRKDLILDLGAEYSFASGSGQTSRPTSKSSRYSPISGEFSSEALGAHSSLRWRF